MRVIRPDGPGNVLLPPFDFVLELGVELLLEEWMAEPSAEPFVPGTRAPILRAREAKAEMEEADGDLLFGGEDEDSVLESLADGEVNGIIGMKSLRDAMWFDMAFLLLKRLLMELFFTGLPFLTDKSRGKVDGKIVESVLIFLSLEGELDDEGLLPLTTAFLTLKSIGSEGGRSIFFFN